ncbi:MAG: RNA chaperone Hfq [Acidobacteria bacterium]|jgi:RNA chaperone Hfq|nr:RNA chaperone Hfq [Acidobacteriota bacterium]
MAQISETRAPAAPDVQDGFLNIARRSRATVRFLLMDGTEFEARVKTFDRFAVIVEHDGTDTMVFKHAIASIRAPRATNTSDSADQG